MRIESGLFGTLGVLSVTAVLTWAPMTSADVGDPGPPPGSPAGDNALPVAPSAATAPASSAVAAEAVPHLVSPQNLPPGATVDPIVPEGRNLGYLRDLWHAVQTQEVSGGDALLLLTQRPMDANASPPPGIPVGP